MTEWSRLDSADLSDIPDGVEVYERNWQRDFPTGLIEFNKWRIFVDRVTFLPQKRPNTTADFPMKDDFTLSSFHVYEYPSDEQMQAVISEN